MLRSWKIGSAFGIGVYIHTTFWILPLFAVLRVWEAGLGLIVLTLALLAAAVGSVILHEFGHALAARGFGIRTRDITLYPIGGVARLERLSDQPIQELLIALAGPAVNVAIAGLLLPFVALGPGLGFLVQGDSALGVFLTSLFFINIWLVVFNLIPAFPMDGGRVLRAILSMPLGRARATEIAATLGLTIAILLGAGYFFLRDSIPFLSNPMLVLVAAFVALVGQQELALVRRQEAMRRAGEGEILTAEPVFDDATVEPARPGFTGFMWDSRARAWVFWRDGRPVAVYSTGPE